MKPTPLPAGNWMLPNESRLSRLPPERQSLLQKQVLRISRKQAGAAEDLNEFKALVRLGPVLPPYLAFLRQILMKGRIPRTDKERIILRVAWRLGCAYEWGHHAHMAAELGISDAEIRSIAAADSPSWHARTSVLMTAVDELLDHRCVAAATWPQLVDQLGEDQAVEFCMVVGHYVMVAGLIFSTGVQIEPGYLDELSAAAISNRS